MKQNFASWSINIGAYSSSRKKIRLFSITLSLNNYLSFIFEFDNLYLKFNIRFESDIEMPSLYFSKKNSTTAFLFLHQIEFFLCSLLSEKDFTRSYLWKNFDKKNLFIYSIYCDRFFKYEIQF